MDALKIPEQEAKKALLSAFTPMNPGTVAAGWKQSSRYGHAPSGRELWSIYKRHKFQCASCKSRHRITVDHIDGDTSNCSMDNLRVLCADCNRAGNSRGTKNSEVNLRLFTALLDYRQSHGINPTNEHLRKATGISDFGGGYYIINYLRWLHGEDVAMRGYKKRADKAVETTPLTGGTTYS